MNSIKHHVSLKHPTAGMTWMLQRMRWSLKLHSKSFKLCLKLFNKGREKLIREAKTHVNNVTNQLAWLRHAGDEFDTAFLRRPFWLRQASVERGGEGMFESVCSSWKQKKITHVIVMLRFILRQKHHTRIGHHAKVPNYPRANATFEHRLKSSGVETTTHSFSGTNILNGLANSFTNLQVIFTVLFKIKLLQSVGCISLIDICFRGWIVSSIAFQKN